jgi:hypothetical protein
MAAVTLKNGSIWNGKDGQKRKIKSVLGDKVMYDVKTITSSAFQNRILLESAFTDVDYFRKYYCQSEATEF